jgi:hypothetical protein
MMSEKVAAEEMAVEMPSTSEAETSVENSSPFINILQEAKYAAETKVVSLTLLAHMKAAVASSYTPKETVEQLSKLAPILRECFEKTNGTIREEYFGVNPLRALVCTDSDCIVEYSRVHPKILDLIFTCDRLLVEAREHADKDCLRQCLQLVYGIETHILDYIGKGKGELLADFTEFSKFILNKSKEIETYYLRSAQRKSIFAYLQGMVYGSAALIVLAIITLILLNFASNPYVPAVWSILAGGSGAIISVLFRMSFEKFELDHEAGVDQIMKLGVSRPIIGAVMGGNRLCWY